MISLCLWIAVHLFIEFCSRESRGWLCCSPIPPCPGLPHTIPGGFSLWIFPVPALTLLLQLENEPEQLEQEAREVWAQPGLGAVV